jgi:hypothetical protein
MKRLLTSLVLVSMFFLAAETAIQAAELNWTAPQYVIGSTESLGRDLDLELDHQGNYHLALAHDDVNTIWYSKWVEPTWTINETAVVIPGTHGYFFSLDLFGNFPVIHFTDNETGNMSWTMRTGSSWTPPETVTGTYSTYFVRSIVDDFGAMHVMHLFRPGGGDSIWYSTDKSGSWVHESISEFAYPEYIVKAMDFALDSTGTPHFVWWDADDETVYYAVRTGSTAYDKSAVADAHDCKWLSLSILDGDIPYFAWRNHTPSDTFVIMSASKIGESFYVNTVVDTSRIVYATDMAVAVEEGVTVENVYYLYSNIDRELRYVRWVGGTGWVDDVIEEVNFPGVISSISARWDAGRNAVGVAIREHAANDVFFLLGYVPSDPTPTPGPSPTPTPTYVPCCDIELDLGPDMDYGPGDWMIGELHVRNVGAPTSADVYVLLEVFGEFWFAPGWTHDLDYYDMTLPSWENQIVTYLSGFHMPDPLPTGGPFYFYAAAFFPGTLEAESIISNVEIKEFNLI